MKLTLDKIVGHHSNRILTAVALGLIYTIAVSPIKADEPLAIKLQSASVQSIQSPQLTLPFRKLERFRVRSYFDQDPRNEMQKKYDGTNGERTLSDVVDNQFATRYMPTSDAGKRVDVLAMNNGTAIIDDTRRGYALIGTPEFFIGYARLTRIVIRTGDTVAQGQKIGEVVSDPNRGNSLHIEALARTQNGTYSYVDLYRDVSGKTGNTSLWPRDNCPVHFEDKDNPNARCAGTLYPVLETFIPMAAKQGSLK